jgi:putative PIN family toxin of toxin-antitoxin system
VRRIVCDVGVVISGLLSSTGPPATVLDRWRDGAFDLVVSPLWLTELDRVVARPKIARHIDSADASDLRDAILRQAVVVDDPPIEHGVTADPGDDYLVGLARASGASCIVSGDRHLLQITDPWPPVLTPRSFIEEVDS